MPNQPQPQPTDPAANPQQPQPGQQEPQRQAPPAIPVQPIAPGNNTTPRQ
jgi:hypothetical protein